MKITVIKLHEIGPDLLTRDQGAPVRRRLRETLDSGGDIRIDFNQVGAMTPSFADELLGRLLLEVGPEVFRARVRLDSATQDLKRLVNKVLAHRLKEFTSGA